jgi:DNA recombination protein RmuC
VVVGPTTLAAILNSLQLGFRTLAIEKRSHEVWQLLGAVKKQFGLFGDLLAKVDERLRQASDTIGDATKKTRHIQSRLSRVEALPEAEAAQLLPELADAGERD